MPPVEIDRVYCERRGYVAGDKVENSGQQPQGSQKEYRRCVFETLRGMCSRGDW